MTLSVLHVTYHFYPDPAGGTERYVLALAKELAAQGIKSDIAAPAKVDSSYTYDDVTIHRFGHNASPNLPTLYGQGDAIATRALVSIVQQAQPSIVHFHALSPSVSAAVMEAVKALGKTVVFTYHTPTVSCLRGTLMRWGTEICDGNIQAQDCTSCVFHARGIPLPFAKLSRCIPRDRHQKSLATINDSTSRVKKLFALPALAKGRKQAFFKAIELADQVVAPAHWVSRLLQENGLPEAKIMISDQGVANTNRFERQIPRGDQLRLLYIGRLDPTKGVLELAKAMRQVRTSCNVRLDIYGIQASGAETYVEQLKRIINNTDNMELHPPVDINAVPQLIANHDALAIPSIWQETGPLVMMEAWQQRVPVLAVRRGGPAETVIHGKNGLLIESGSPGEWKSLIETLATNPDICEKMSATIPAPRTMADVAKDMQSLYHQLLTTHSD